RDSLLFTQQPEQQVLCAYVTVAKIAGFAHGELENFLGARCIRQVGASRGCGFPFLDGFFDLLLDLVEIYAEILKDRRGDTLSFADKAEQYVLGADVFVMEPRRLLTGHGENLSHSLCEV